MAEKVTARGTLVSEEPDKQPVEKPKMEVPVDTLQNLLDTVAALQKDRNEDKKKISALEQVVSQTRLQEAKDKTDEDKRRRVHFKKLQQGVVIGWPDKRLEPEKIRNEWIINPNNGAAMGEIIRAKYKLADGAETDFVEYTDFVRCNDLVYARVIEEKSDSAILEFEDKSVKAEPVEIKKVFWNA